MLILIHMDCGICWFTDMPIYYFVDFIEPDGVNLQYQLILFRPMVKNHCFGKCIKNTNVVQFFSSRISINVDINKCSWITRPRSFMTGFWMWTFSFPECGMGYFSWGVRNGQFSCEAGWNQLLVGWRDTLIVNDRMQDDTTFFRWDGGMRTHRPLTLWYNH